MGIDTGKHVPKMALFLMAMKMTWLLQKMKNY